MSKTRKFDKKIKNGSSHSKAFNDIRKMVLKAEKQNEAGNRRNATAYSSSTAEVIESYAASANEQQSSYNTLTAGFDEALIRMENVVSIVNELDTTISKEANKRKSGDEAIQNDICDIKEELNKLISIVENMAYLFDECLDIDVFASKKNVKKQIKKKKKRNNSYTEGIYQSLPVTTYALPYNKQGGDL